LLASLFDPLHRLLANPQLAWIVIWIGLALLIVALIVMICTSWGQSQPLRKCAGLSLLAHLLLAGYATTVEIVTATSIGHRGSVDVVIVDGDPDGNADFGLPEGERPGLALRSSTDGEPITAPDAVSNETVSPAAQSFAVDANQPISAVPSPPPPPLLDVAQAKPFEDISPRPVEAKIEDAPAEPLPMQGDNVAAVVPEPMTPTDNKAAQPLASDDSGSELSKLPEPPTTPLNSEWVSGAPSGASHEKSTSDNQLTELNHADASEMQNTSAGSTNSVTSNPDGSAVSSDQTGNGASKNFAAAGPVVESASPQIASRPGPQIYSDRTAGDRAAILRARGGSAEGESAVQAALRWLAANQSADGRWDADKFGAGRELAVLGHNRQNAGAHADTGVTGLALLTFLGAGNTHQHGEFAPVVQHGLEFLLAAQSRDGNLAGDAETFAFMYCHGMATLALSEAYAMTGDKRLETSVKAAINYTISAQIPITGGWRYRANEPATEMGDTSQLGWQLMALKSAELAGIEMPARTREGIVRFIKSVSMGSNGGIASYQPGVRKPNRTMTAEALVCRQFMGMTRDNPASDEAGDFLVNELPSPDRINLYYWYYGTLGTYQLQGDHWQRWNTAMQTTLISRQRVDGDSAGSWDPDCLWGGYGGRVYSTAMSTLCLEVYYRYLPLYRVAGKGGTTSAR
jgi:hypothetical protein